MNNNKLKKISKKKHTIVKKSKRHKSSKKQVHNYKKKTRKKTSQSFLKRFLNKKSRRINSLFNNKDIKKMIAFFNEDDNTFTKEETRCMCIDYNVNNNNITMENNQDYRRCKNKTISGSNFCSKHQNCPQLLQSGLNGFEIPYNPQEWSHPYIEGTHNCYSYFLNNQVQAIKNKCESRCLKKYGRDSCPKKIKECGGLKPQPGNHYLMMKDGHLKNKKRDYKCGIMEKKIKLDNPSLKTTSLLEKCPPNYYKGAMVIDDNHTFHFYRQNAKDATWSHKPGTMAVTDLDASNKKIFVPHFANRDYSHKPNKIKYNSFCNYYCIPRSSYIQKNSI